MKSIALCLAAVTIAVAAFAAEPTFRRTILQRSDVNATQESIMGLAEMDPGGVIGRHYHHGIEMTYVLEGEVELTIDGEAPKRFKAGEVFLVPAGKIHTARNVGKGMEKSVGVYTVEKGKPLAEPVN